VQASWIRIGLRWTVKCSSAINHIKLAFTESHTSNWNLKSDTDSVLYNWKFDTSQPSVFHNHSLQENRIFCAICSKTGSMIYDVIAIFSFSSIGTDCNENSSAASKEKATQLQLLLKVLHVSLYLWSYLSLSENGSERTFRLQYLWQREDIWIQ
jgi:hypothetical protein